MRSISGELRSTIAMLTKSAGTMSRMRVTTVSMTRSRSSRDRIAWSMSERVSKAVNWLPRRAAIELNDEASSPNSSSGRNIHPGRKIPVTRAARAVDELSQRTQRATDLHRAQHGHEQQRQQRPTRRGSHSASAIGAMAAASSCRLPTGSAGQDDDHRERNQRRHNEERNDAAGRPAVEKCSFDPHVR